MFKKFLNFATGLGIGFGLAIGFHSLASITVDLGVDKAVQYIKKIFLTQDGTQTTPIKIVLNGENGNVSMSGNLQVDGSGTVDGNIYVGEKIYDKNDNDVDIGEKLSINLEDNVKSQITHPFDNNKEAVLKTNDSIGVYSSISEGWINIGGGGGLSENYSLLSLDDEYMNDGINVWFLAHKKKSGTAAQNNLYIWFRKTNSNYKALTLNPETETVGVNVTSSEIKQRYNNITSLDSNNTLSLLVKGGTEIMSPDWQSYLILRGKSDNGETYSALYLGNTLNPSRWVMAYKPRDDSFEIGYRTGSSYTGYRNYLTLNPETETVGVNVTSSEIKQRYNNITSLDSNNTLSLLVKGGTEIISPDWQSYLILRGKSDNGETYSALYLGNTLTSDLGWTLAYKATDGSFEIGRHRGSNYDIKVSITDNHGMIVNGGIKTKCIGNCW